MNFDVAACKEGEGAGVWVKSPRGSDLNYSYKFSCNCTNNEEKYEAMMLAIQIVNGFHVSRVGVHGDSKLVI